MYRFGLRLLTASCILALAVPAFAQTEAAPKKVESAVLENLYEQLLALPNNSYLQKRIAEERQNIRNQIDDELQALADAVPQEPTQTATDLPKTVDRLRTLVKTLQDQQEERQVDKDLLEEEEQTYYLRPSVGTGTQLLPDEYRLTKTHAELLAKKAVLEERLAALQNFLLLQQDRLALLDRQQQMRQFETVFTLGKYAFALLCVWLVNWLLRALIFSQIPQKERRYVIMKLFSFVLYTVTGLWIVGSLLWTYPNLSAAFAIVGAGFTLAFQDVIKAFLGWMTIIQNQLFTKGDRISLQGITGDVIDISILRTVIIEVGLPPASVLERTGRVLFIPNNLFLIHPVTNHNTTSDFAKAELRFTLTYESNWEAVKPLLETIIREETAAYVEQERLQHAQRTWRYFVPHEPSAGKVFVEPVTDGVEMTLRFSVPVGDRREVGSRITQRMLAEFRKRDDVTFAYRVSRSVEEKAESPDA